MPDNPDTRSIDDIPFAQDISDPTERAAAQAQIRQMFHSVGAVNADLVIRCGCTGLVKLLDRLCPEYAPGEAIQAVRFAREHMAGAGFGVPCYVPPTRFCLIHNVVGGLQPNQIGYHPEGLELCSRELTPEETAHASGMLAFVADEGAKKAKERFGAERVDAVEPPAESTPSMLKDGFRCPEHATTVWKCRYCLAALILNGPLEPEAYAEVGYGKDQDNNYLDDLAQLPELLATTPGQSVKVFVCVKSWTRRLVED